MEFLQIDLSVDGETGSEAEDDMSSLGSFLCDETEDDGGGGDGGDGDGVSGSGSEGGGRDGDVSSCSSESACMVMPRAKRVRELDTTNSSDGETDTDGETEEVVRKRRRRYPDSDNEIDYIYQSTPVDIEPREDVVELPSAIESPFRVCVPSEMEVYDGLGTYRSGQSRTTTLRRMWLMLDDPSTDVLRDMDRLAAASLADLARIKFPSHRLIRFPKLVPDFPMAPSASELRQLNMTSFIATSGDLDDRYHYILEMHVCSKLRIVTLPILAINEALEALRQVDQSLTHVSTRNRYRRDVLAFLPARVDLDARSVVELGLACLLVDLFKGDINGFEYPHPSPIEAPPVSEAVSAIRRDIVAANHGLDRDVWLAAPSLRKIESTSEIVISNVPFSSEAQLTVPTTAWDETVTAIKTNPDWASTLDSIVTPPLIGRRRVVPLFPRLQNEEGHLEVPDLSTSHYTTAAVNTLLSSFSVDTEARALEVLQRGDSTEACRLLVSAIHLGDAIFDSAIPALPFRCLDEAHALQYLTSGRPCLLLSKPICDGLYKLQNNKSGTTGVQLLREAKDRVLPC